jgi:small-conductance mechanosensitive channel
MESPFDQTQRFASVWMDYAAKMSQAGMTFDPAKAPPEVARQMRSMMFTSMAQYAEEFMRSPQFLEAMKQSMDAAVAFRKQMNDFLTTVQHNAQGVARQDIDSLMLNLRHSETRLLEAIEQIGERIDSIGQRLDALENPPQPAVVSGGE